MQLENKVQKSGEGEKTVNSSLSKKETHALKRLNYFKADGSKNISGTVVGKKHSAASYNAHLEYNPWACVHFVLCALFAMYILPIGFKARLNNILFSTARFKIMKIKKYIYI